MVEQALLRQRKATSRKQLKGMLELNAVSNELKQEHGDDHPLETLKGSITHIDHNGPSRWKKKAPTSPAGPQQAEKSVAETRLLTCITCQGHIDAKHMQLEVKDGHRIIECPHCPWRGRSTHLNCECGIRWF